MELRGPGGRHLLNPRTLPFEYASGVAEGHVRSQHREWFSDTDAAWRKAPATEKQTERLRDLGVAVEAGLTREAAMESNASGRASFNRCSRTRMRHGGRRQSRRGRDTSCVGSGSRYPPGR